MKNKGVMISLAVILAVGILITKSTHSFVQRSLSDMAETEGSLAQEQAFETSRLSDWEADGVEAAGEESGAANSMSKAGGVAAAPPESISPLDPAPMAAATAEKAADSAERGAAAEEPVSSYMRRLLDLDAQIQKNRDAQTGSNGNNSAKSAASNELKLWDSELNTIYNEILKRLDKEDSEKLVEAQRAWLKARDSLAMEAARNSAGGSRESVEYTVSLTESTRQRAYELAELYAYELEQ